MVERDVVAVPASEVRCDQVQPLTDPREGRDSYVHHLLESLRVLIVSGILVGVTIAGIGSRLAMLLIRLTSSDQVNGLESDDGFTIGEVTFAGTYNLFMIGAIVGIIGAGAYQWVRPWLMGPTWLRRVTVGAGAGVVVGSMLVHADGVDFVVLTPTSLTITMFIALPALFGLAIGPVVDRVEQPSSWTARGRTRVALPLVLVALFPLTLFVIPVAAFVIAVWLVVRRIPTVERATNLGVTAWTMRAFCVLIATAGLAALIGDVRAINAVT